MGSYEKLLAIRIIVYLGKCFMNYTDSLTNIYLELNRVMS